MFGGYGIFHEGDIFALISGDTLYFKVDDFYRAAYENAGSKPFARCRTMRCLRR
ncbi:TfoX/Sxy family protein [Chloroflexota bacterium]